MILSRAKPAIETQKTDSFHNAERKKAPKLDSFIQERDYTGAITLLEFIKASGKMDNDMRAWLGYSFFHLGDYQKAMDTYLYLTKDPQRDPNVHLYLACCYFFLGMYKEADDEAQKAPSSKLQNRLLFHLSHKFNDEKRLMGYHQNLQDIVEDQLTLASMHYLRGHYQEAIEIYKRLLLENRDLSALNVYIAMCYYKLDYYDVSQEVLSIYLQSFPTSLTAINLKACNHVKLYNGKAAENELKMLSETAHPNFRFAEDLIKHNLVVFKNGEGALQILSPLIDVIMEARLNLVIYHLRNDEILAAYDLMKDVEPSNPNEYILKGIVNALLGQEQESREHLKIAQQYFQLVGGSASECDTIPGRQCMASCFFILKQFEDVDTYLSSIKGYLFNDDVFNYNFAQTKVALNSFQEAEEALLNIQNEKFKNEYTFTSHLVKCYIANKKPRLAWELYLKMETSSESFNVLQLIANDCYKLEHYFYAAKAFDVLERLDPSPEYWDGKQGACVGVLKQIMNGLEPKDSLKPIVSMLRNSSSPQVEYILAVMRKFAKEQRISI